MLASTSCYHCGLPVADSTEYRLEVDNQSQSFCCPGCLAVAQTIMATGLADYYHYRTAPAVKAAELEQALLEELQLYDHPDIQQDFVRPLDGDQLEATLLIEGITCAACGWLIEHQLNNLPGVTACSVNLSNNRARIQWRKEEVAISEILQRLHAIGYRGHPYQPAKQDLLMRMENRDFLQRLGVAGIGMAQVMMYAVALYAGAFEGMTIEHRNFIRWVSLLITTPVVLYSAYPFFSAAARGLSNRQLTMDIPVSLAIAAAYSASIWSTLVGGPDVYFDSVCMFTFFLLLGRFLEFRARNRINQTARGLHNLLPNSAVRLMQGSPQKIFLHDIRPADQLMVKAGETIPADGIIVEGASSVNESQLTGEFLPIQKTRGCPVIAGSINIDQPLVIEVTDSGNQTRLASILRMLDNAVAAKPPIAIIAERVAHYFIGFVLLLAATVALAWALIDPEQAFWITLSVLVVTCPCALSLATPTALTAATGQLLKQGFMINQSHTLEGLGQATHIIFDKTGTLTQGKLTLEQVVPIGGLSAQQCLQLAASLESQSAHPIAKAFQAEPLPISAVTVAAGNGIQGQINEQTYRIGRPEYALAVTAAGSVLPPPAQGQWVLLASHDGPLAWFQLRDALRPGAAQTVRQLKALGLTVEILSGDHSQNVADIATQLEIAEASAGASPEQKMNRVRQLQQKGAQVIMVGDGINDIPVLANADVSIAMTNASDLTKTSADAVLISGELTHLVSVIRCARRTQQVIKQNIAWALGYNISALPLAALGFIPPYLAAIGMSASSLLVVINAMRLNKPITHQQRQ